MECQIPEFYKKTDFKMKSFKYTIDGKEYNVEIASVNDDYVAELTVNGQPFEVQMQKPEQPAKEKPVLGKPVQADAAEATPVANVDANKAVKAPLPGTITEIKVSVGQEVKKGDTLVVLEAMKMANNIEAESDGKVTAIYVKNGQSVMEEDPLVAVE